MLKVLKVLLKSVENVFLSVETVEKVLKLYMLKLLLKKRHFQHFSVEFTDWTRLQGVSWTLVSRETKEGVETACAQCAGIAHRRSESLKINHAKFLLS